jgi:hypothetical protein
MLGGALGGGLGSAAGGVLGGGIGGGLGSAIGGVLKAMGPYGAAVEAATGALVAFGSAVVWLPRALSSFVQALDPNRVALFELAMGSLTATVAQSLLPMFDVFTAAIRGIADVLAPTFERLRGVVDTLSRAFVSALLPAVRVAADVFDILIGFAERYSGVFAALGEVIAAAGRMMVGVVSILGTVADAFTVLLAPLIAIGQGVLKVFAAQLEQIGAVFKILAAVAGELIAALGGGDLGIGDAFDRLVSSMQTATRNMVLFAAGLMKAFGATGMLDRLIKQYQQDRGGKALQQAPADFGITDFRSLIREQTLAAARSSAVQAGGARPVEQTAEEMVKELQAIKDGTATLPAKVQEAIDAVVDVVAAVQDVKAVVEGIRSAIPNPGNVLGAAAPVIGGGPAVLGLRALLGGR